MNFTQKMDHLLATSQEPKPGNELNAVHYAAEALDNFTKACQKVIGQDRCFQLEAEGTTKYPEDEMLASYWEVTRICHEAGQISTMISLEDACLTAIEAYSKAHNDQLGPISREIVNGMRETIGLNEIK